MSTVIDGGVSESDSEIVPAQPTVYRSVFNVIPEVPGYMPDIVLNKI